MLTSIFGKDKQSRLASVAQCQGDGRKLAIAVHVGTAAHPMVGTEECRESLLPCSSFHRLGRRGFEDLSEETVSSSCVEIVAKTNWICQDMYTSSGKYRNAKLDWIVQALNACPSCFFQFFINAPPILRSHPDAKSNAEGYRSTTARCQWSSQAKKDDMKFDSGLRCCWWSNSVFNVDGWQLLGCRISSENRCGSKTSKYMSIIVIFVHSWSKKYFSLKYWNQWSQATFTIVQNCSSWRDARCKFGKYI